MVDPCKVCGGTDLNLVDGFYYCIECGTQDQTAREVVVERAELGDGTFAIGTRRKLTTKTAKLQMSGEWYKWHAYNFILCGLTNELIALGAKPSLKSMVLWIWTRYIKKYHIREEYQMNSAQKKNQLIDSNNDEVLSDDGAHPATEDLNDTVEVPLSRNVKDIRTMTYTNIYGILYVALNLDKSDIQLSHFLRYIKEGRLTFQDCIKYIPADFNIKKIPQWMSFLNSRTNPFSSNGILKVAVALFKRLDLGTPMIPDLRALVNIYVKELCLPNDFLHLVLSLYELMPVEVGMARFLKLTTQFPDFESIAMSYVLMALKMCFGLDDHYELKLSDIVDKINEEENYLKSYRVGITEPSDRLFSFREWIKYLEFRKIILCQYYQPMASKHNFDEDNFIVSELLKDGMIETEIKRVNVELEHELLKRIPLMTSYDIIAKEEFPVSQTPLTTYTQFLITRIPDSQKRFLLSEDFSKYSLKYACVGMVLKDDDGQNVIKGVIETNKTLNGKILGTLRYQDTKCNTISVFIKDTDNKDWIKDFEAANVVTNSDNENLSDEDILSVYSKETETNDVKLEKPVKCEVIEELDEEENIFNDNFEDIEWSQQHNSPNESLHQPEHVFEFNDAQLESLHENEANYSTTNLIAGNFDPSTFDRGEVIKQLILTACRKYKIPIPLCYKEPKARKRRIEDTPTVPRDKVKRQRRAGGIRAMEINNILTKYHTLQQRNVSQNEGPVAPDSNETNALEQNNEPDINATTYNPAEPQNLGDETLDQENIAEINAEPESGIGSDIIVSDNDNDSDIDELLKDDDGNFDDCLENETIKQILIKEILDFQTNRAEKLKSLKETLQRQGTEIKPKHNKRKRKSKLVTLDPLIPNSENVHEFKYYVRHYVKRLLLKHPRRSYGFETELTANCPKSFKYLLQLCASIIEVPAWNLFRVFQFLEIYMMEQV